VAKFESLLCGLKEEVWVYIVEQSEDYINPISGLPVERVENFGDPSFGDALQGDGWRLQFLGTEFVFEFHLTRKDCSSGGFLCGRSLNHCACERDVITVTAALSRPEPSLEVRETRFRSGQKGADHFSRSRVV